VGWRRKEEVIPELGGTHSQKDAGQIGKERAGQDVRGVEHRRRSKRG
jgi:hypothetical protein